MACECITECDCIKTPRRGNVNMYLKEIISLEEKLRIAVELAEVVIKSPTGHIASTSAIRHKAQDFLEKIKPK